MFWTVFLTVLAALWVWDLVEDYRRSHYRWKVYCLVLAKKHHQWSSLARKRGDSKQAEENGKQSMYWNKEAKSWWGMRPEDPEDAAADKVDWDSLKDRLQEMLER